jgi:uncharacterized protein YegJ (DUF2314 family)
MVRPLRSQYRLLAVVVAALACHPGTDARPGAAPAERAGERAVSAPVAWSGGFHLYFYGTLAVDSAVMFSADDLTRVQARRRARCRLPELVRRVRVPPPGQTALAVQARLREGDATEDLWVRVVAAVPDTLLRGVLEEEPRLVRRFRRGDTVSVGPDAVVDWYAEEGGVRVGDFDAAARRASARAAVEPVARRGPALTVPAFTAPPPDLVVRPPAGADSLAPGWLTTRCS